jgi:hypothetical protein
MYIAFPGRELAGRAVNPTRYGQCGLANRVSFNVHSQSMDRPPPRSAFLVCRDSCSLHAVTELCGSAKRKRYVHRFITRKMDQSLLS